MEKILDTFSRSDVFKDISEDDLEVLGKATIGRKLNQGEYLTLQGDLWPYAVLVKSGQLCWKLLSLSGKERILFTIDPGGEFWAHTLFDEEPMPASLYAMQETEVYLWEKEILLPILHRNPKAMWSLMLRLIRRMRGAREIVYGLAFQPVSARLARLFIDRFVTENQPQTERDLTLEQIAAMISSTPQVVCKAMYQFQDEGLLQISRATIKLEDIEALRNIAERG